MITELTQNADADGMETCTVADLVAALLKVPQDAAVITEGCDCYGNCSAVDYDRGYVLINRSN